MSDDKSVSSVFAGFAHRTSVPTRSMDAVLTPLQEQVQTFLALPSPLVLNADQRQKMITDGQRIQSVLVELQKKAALMERDDDLGVTAAVRHRLIMDHDSAVEHSSDLVLQLRQSTGSGANTLAVDKIGKAAHGILSSVTSALYAYDQTVIIRIEAVAGEISEVGVLLTRLLEESPVHIDSLQGALKELSDHMVKLGELTQGRIQDLKDGCQRSEMDCCRVMIEHCFRSFLSSVKVRLQHSVLSIGKMNCMAVMDNFLEMVGSMTRAAALPYDDSTWKKATPLAQEFDVLERMIAHANEDMSDDSKKEECGRSLCSQLDSIILHAKQVAESPRTGDRAGDRLLQSCEEAVGCLSNLLQLASEDEDKLSNGGGGSVFVGTTNTPTKPGSRRGSFRTSESGRSSFGSGITIAGSIYDCVDGLNDAVTRVRQQTQMALHQHTSAALAQMHRDRSLVEYLQQNASVRNNAKTSDYTSQLLRQVERYEEVVSLVCSISTDLPNVLRVRRALAELRVLCPQAVAAAHVLFQFPSSKVALESMASFEYAWHVELDALMAALKCLAPSEKAQRDSVALDRTRSASMHALSGPRLSSASVHRTSSINSFANFRQRLQLRKRSPSSPDTYYV